MTHYNGTPLSALSLWDLGQIEKNLKEAEAKRVKASQHPKFDKNHDKYVCDFPPPNPEFLKLKEAVENEIKERQKNG